MNEVQLTNANDIYSNSIQQYDALLIETTKRYDLVSWARLGAIFLGGLFIYFMGQWNLIALIVSIIVVLIVFVRLVIYHVSLGNHKDYLTRLKQLNLDEIEYLKGSFVGQANGQQYLDELHPYAVDLDIFGPRSVFHFINRTQTKMGERKLAKALLTPAEIEEIRNRQKAVDELAMDLEWRQDFLATVDVQENDLDHLAKIKNWLLEPDKLLKHRWITWGKFLVPLMTILLTTIVIVGGYPLSFLVFIILVPGIILSKYANIISDIQNHTDKSQERIGHYAQLISKVEKQSFRTEKLIVLQNKLISDNKQKASVSIAQLGYLIRQLNVRNNPFSILLNLFSFWDFHWAIALEKWKNRHKNEVNEWFEALGDFDFLISLANLRYNYPEFYYPDLNETYESFQATGIKHPLIFSHDAVGNNLNIHLKQKVMLITGSNMAGKSTFLRSIGVNLVIAFAGGPVHANRLSAPIMHIFTSMRTRDNIHESTSSFYAELKRLQAAMKGVEKNSNAFVLFDEILKGTNSVDRHTGARGIIKQIIQSKSAGVVATHDLDLAKMETETNGMVENWCFDVTITNGKLDFDYLIKRGVCSSFNATYLMKEMGFNIDVNENNAK